MRWLFLIHQLPPRPPYLRAKIRNRLAQVGALALKNSVYVLPEREDCLEDLQWIAEEAGAGGGEAFVTAGELASGLDDATLVERFRASASAAYEELRTQVAAANASRGKPSNGGARPERISAAELGRLRRWLAECASRDFFAAPGRKEAETMMSALERRAGRSARGSPTGKDLDLAGRTWVTRRGPKVDRLSSAWLIRRRIDPGARIRFVDPERYRRRSGELTFDMAGGDFTHEGNRCTFETLVARLGLDEPALTAIAEIVHDLDLKEDRFGRPEATGVGRLVDGLVARHPGDAARLEHGLELFDTLHAALAGEGPLPPAPAKPRAAGRRAPRRGRRRS